MRRADRLFKITEYMKSRHNVVRAYDLADFLDVSLRTIYRDMADLMLSGIPITGEAGTGYIMDKDYIIRPLMFDLEEIDALALGAKMIQSWGDLALSKSATSALNKIYSTLPTYTRDRLGEEFMFSFASNRRPEIHVDFSGIRRAIRNKQKLSLTYKKDTGEESDRKVRPLALAFFAPIWVLLGWCEARNDFRNFRVDRIETLLITNDKFHDEKGKRLSDYTP